MMTKEEKLNDYDSEPVKYCARCYSLKVKYEEAVDMECCAECGSSDIAEAPIHDWEQMYERRYGHKYAVKTEDPKKTFIFQLPMNKLKAKVYNNPQWHEIITTLYPRFPGGLSRVDCILLFFDKLIKDNRLDELRLLLFKRFNT